MKTYFYMILLFVHCLFFWGSNRAHAQFFGESSSQTRSYELLRTHFKKYPKQILRGKVVSRAQSISAGEAMLYLDFPSSLSFQFTGQNAFDSNFHQNTFKVKSFPNGRTNPAEIKNFSKIDNLMITTLAKLMTSLQEESISAFLLGHIFDWKIQYLPPLHILNLESSQPLSTLKSMELRFNEEHELKFVSSELNDKSGIHEFHIVESSYPKTIDASIFQ